MPKSKKSTLQTHFTSMIVKVDPARNPQGLDCFNTGRFKQDHGYPVLITTERVFGDGSREPVFLVHDISTGEIFEIAVTYCTVVVAN